MIYFLHDPVSRAVKIGVADDPVRRMKVIQTANPNPLHLLGAIPGAELEEADYHRQFAAHHLRGEWFRADPDLLESVRLLIAERASPLPYEWAEIEPQWLLCSREFCVRAFRKQSPDFRDLLNREARRLAMEKIGLPLQIVLAERLRFKAISFRAVKPSQNDGDWWMYPDFWDWNRQFGVSWDSCAFNALSSVISEFRHWHWSQYVPPGRNYPAAYYGEGNPDHD